MGCKWDFHKLLRQPTALLSVLENIDLNRYNYFEEIIESSQSGIDWEQRRYEIAKDMLCAIYMDDGNEKRSDCLGKKFEYQSLEGSAREAVRYANVLIEELKKYDNG